MYVRKLQIGNYIKQGNSFFTDNYPQNQAEILLSTTGQLLTDIQTTALLKVSSTPFFIMKKRWKETYINLYSTESLHNADTPSASRTNPLVAVAVLGSIL